MAEKDSVGTWPFTIRLVQELASNLLKQLGIDNSLFEAQLMLGEALQKSRIEIQIDSARLITEKELTLFWSMMARRMQYEPIAYIFQKKEFYSHDFLVTKDSLIPRPDTEIIIEKCLALLKPNSDAVVFDIGTGSGAIAISLLLLRSKISVWASDISKAALEIAKINGEHHGVFKRLKLLEGDLLAPYGQKAHLIVSNPPYIASHEIAHLAPDVRDFEPKLALDGGDDGLIFYRRLLNDAYDYLYSPGYLVMETGFSQRDQIEKLIDSKWRSYEFFLDLSGHQRGIVLEK